MVNFTCRCYAEVMLLEFPASQSWSDFPNERLKGVRLWHDPGPLLFFDFISELLSIIIGTGDFMSKMDVVREFKPITSINPSSSFSNSCVCV